MTRAVDITSAIGKAPTPETHFPLIVVGAGPAGMAAALAAAEAGVPTLLLDENPIGGDLMALDVPLHFGQRFDGSVRTKGRMVERIVAAQPEIETAFELGIDVQLGVYAWGAFVNSESVHALTVPLIGLADDDRSWMASFDRLIVATGARDLGLAFDGWEKPGVMGAQAFFSLLGLYRAFSGRRLLILGSTAGGLRAALTALDRGLEVAGIVEVDATTRGPADLRARLEAKGVPILTRHAIVAATGAAEVEGAVLRSLDDERDVRLACDTIVSAIGRVPNIELLDMLGCKLAFRRGAGGYVPVTDELGATSIPGVCAVGDCCQASEAGITDDAAAVRDGRGAAQAVAASLGKGYTAAAVPGRRQPPLDAVAYWQRWSAAEIAVTSADTPVCLCEEVSRTEITGLHPPRYLNWQSGQMDDRSLATLLKEGPINQDQVKRLTRAGMGPCQGRRCREQVQMLLSATLDTPMEQIPLASYRAPVRPLPLATLADQTESEVVHAHWVPWFNIPSQWTPHWEPHPEAAPGLAVKSDK